MKNIKCFKISSRILLVLGSLFISGSAISQYNIYRFQPPKGEVNLFTASDDNVSSQEYNSLTTRLQRDSVIRKRLDEDWTDTIPARQEPPYIWVCGAFELQLITNSHDWGDGVFNGEAGLLYGGYRGFDLDSIYMNGGTLKDIGKLGNPLCGVTIFDSITRNPGHAMAAVLVGDDMTKWEDWNFIEPGYNTMNVVPGDDQSTNLPLTCEHVSIGYYYLTTTVPLRSGV